MGLYHRPGLPEARRDGDALQFPPSNHPCLMCPPPRTPCGCCWQSGGPHCGGCCPAAVISAFIGPGLHAFERKLHIMSIILCLWWASLFNWVIGHRGRIGLIKAECGLDLWRNVNLAVALPEEPLWKTTSLRQAECSRLLALFHLKIQHLRSYFCTLGAKLANVYWLVTRS